MKKNLIALTILIATIAAIISLGVMPKVASKPDKFSGPKWESSGLLSQGEVLLSRKPPRGIYKKGEQDTLVGTVLNEAITLMAHKGITVYDQTVWIQVRLNTDHRWTRYDPLEAEVRGDKIVLKIPTSVLAGPHIENYVPSDFSSSIVKLEGLKGTYTVYLGEQRMGSISFLL